MAERWSVSEVARAAHVTVRTLHHYDEIGLLVPSERSHAGYRLYSRADLERLQQIRLYRELGFTLDAIARLLEQPPPDRRAALIAQRELLLERRHRTEAVIDAVDRTLKSIEEGTTMTAEEMFDGFEDLVDAPEDVRRHHRQHAREAKQRWGDSDAYAQSMRRARGYSKEQWQEIQRQGAENEAKLAALLADRADPTGEEAMAAAEAMRLHIDRWFYPCSPRMHAGLADMYEQDARFRSYYEQRAEGLAAFVANAIRANAARAAGAS